jgi:hypothetical protein
MARPLLNARSFENIGREGKIQIGEQLDRRA